MFSFHRILIAYAVAIPLALILGFLVATPDMASMAVVCLVFFALALPLLLHWNHWLLIFFWNSAFVFGFLPGQLPIWLAFAGLAFGIGVVNRVMGHRNFLSAPELTKPILFLVAVVVVTARHRGAAGMQVFGSESFGGKHYVYLLGAVIGYFGLISQPISSLKSGRMVKLFFLSGATHALTNLIYVLGPAFYILYYFFSVGSAYGQAAVEYGQEFVMRYGGLGPTGLGLLCFILAAWGIRGVFEWTKPWRMLLFIAALVASLFSGFRSQIFLVGLLLVVQFMVEGLWKTAFLPAFFLLGVLCLAPVLMFTNKMPFAVQRTLAILPGNMLNIDPDVREEAENSTLWRVEMWREVLPLIPQYLLIGKGYAIDPTDLYLSEEAQRMGLLPNYTLSLTAGDYHSGPLSVLVPLGAFGTLGFLWLLVAGAKVLYRNRRYGDPKLRMVNNLLLSYFVTQTLTYIFVFGAFDSQLYLFLGILGLSVSLNGGVRRKAAAKAVAATVPAAVELQPA